ncbi:unnamed protein product [Paramecium sonneborni]|uniref:Uncharacterized protein n=1 Tax=Paramecium sonneborni TaxID=65129 RepID=A0A8S1PJ81_9CILI|nr:unnamed protein product [Paramecium sonneborni]
MNINCQLAGYHQDEPLELLCLNTECISKNKVLNCLACVEQNHSGHQVIHYKKFITLLQKQGAQLLNEIDFKLQDSANMQNDMLTKIREIIKQLTELQDIVNDAINKQKEMLERKLQYYEQFACILPNYEIFNQAIKLNDQNLLQKLMTQFLSKVEYNQKRQELIARNDCIIDQSEETEGENILFRKLKEFINSFKQDIDNNNNCISQNSQLSTSFKQKKYSQTNDEFKRSHQRISSYKRMVSIEKSPGSPDDRISITQSLSQFYYKPNRTKKRVGEQIQLIETQNTYSTTYQFHPECFGQGLQITPKQVKLITDNDKRIAIIKPSIYGSGLTREQQITIIIKVCRSSNQRYPMAVGICDQSKLQEDNFIFSGSAEHVSGSHNKDHGCYLLNSNGYIRSMTGQDMSKSSPNLRFYSNSTLELSFKPFHKQLIIKRDQQVQTIIPLEFHKDQKLFFCVRLADLHDCIEIV